MATQPLAARLGSHWAERGKDWGMARGLWSLVLLRLSSCLCACLPRFRSAADQSVALAQPVGSRACAHGHVSLSVSSWSGPCPVALVLRLLA